jgi:Rps23 Pro-64 3,4-dihydroxylase Tpa1-like proline 4-hydroxylase
MWLNDEQVTDIKLDQYQESLLSACPNHIVIDGLFNEAKLDDVMHILQQSPYWQTQQHTYSALYVDSAAWKNATAAQRFVQRDVWKRDAVSPNLAEEFLSFLRSDAFMSVLSRLFNVQLTDINVAEPEINTNYFRLASTDFVEQHADDSPGREVCMLLYLNKNWSNKKGGELSFIGNKDNQPITISPLYNRCIFFNPSSSGSEHWVEKLRFEDVDLYRFNVTSWYWRE